MLDNVEVDDVTLEYPVEDEGAPVDVAVEEEDDPFDETGTMQLRRSKATVPRMVSKCDEM